MNQTYKDKNRTKDKHVPAAPITSFKVNRTQISVWPNKSQDDGLGFITIERIFKQNNLYRKSRYFPAEEVGDLLAAISSMQLFCTAELQKERIKRMNAKYAAKKKRLGDGVDDDEFEEDEQK